MYRYAVSFTDQTHTNIRDTILQAKSNNASSNIQVATNGSGEVYASDLKEARVNANEKFVDKTVESVLKEKTRGLFTHNLHSRTYRKLRFTIFLSYFPKNYHYLIRTLWRYAAYSGHNCLCAPRHPPSLHSTSTQSHTAKPPAHRRLERSIISSP